MMQITLLRKYITHRSTNQNFPTDSTGGWKSKEFIHLGKELNRVHPTVRSTNESDFNEYVFLNFN